MREFVIGFWILLCVWALNVVFFDLGLHEQFKFISFLLSAILVLMVPVVVLLGFFGFVPKELKESEETLTVKEWKNRVLISHSLILLTLLFILSMWVLGLKLNYFDLYKEFFVISTLISLYVMLGEIKILPLRKIRYEETSRYSYS